MVRATHPIYDEYQQVTAVHSPSKYNLKELADFYQLNSKQIQEIFDVPESAQFHEVLTRFQEIRCQAIELFEEEEKAKRWFARVRKDLQGQTPTDAMKTDVGAEQVRSILYQTEYGVFG
jgi:Protein of unknown function (DUF2384)